MPLTQVDQGLLNQFAQYTGFKNRIINGGMVIDQRNAGASVTVNGQNDLYTLDRFYANGQATDGVFTVQRDTVAPAGFVNSFKVTVTTADASIGASQFYVISQAIEGVNCADLGWGAAGAQTVTLSFWVRSSVTGTFGGSIRNSAVNRSYPFTYSISSANTWEQKSITIPGDTTGTWLTDTGVGIRVTWSLGDGSSRLGTANTWAASNFSGVIGQTQLISTLNATWFVTGVQLERGSTATSFDFRPYGTELGLCQRYYSKSGGNTTFVLQSRWSDGSMNGSGFFKVSMRATPTMTSSNANVSIDRADTEGFYANGTAAQSGTRSFDWTASAEL